MIDLTPLDVRNKRGDFKKIMRGYDPQEVDVFLEIVADRLEALVRENLQLRERTQTLQSQVDAQAGREQAVQDALVTAQELRAEMQNHAQREADHIMKEAEVEARRLLAEADAEVRNRLRGVERRLDQGRDALDDLERRRARFLKEFRSLLEREMDVVSVEEGRAPLEDRAIDLDLGSSRMTRTETHEVRSPGPEGTSDTDASPDEAPDEATAEGDPAPARAEPEPTGEIVDAEDAGPVAEPPHVVAAAAVAAAAGLAAAEEVDGAASDAGAVAEPAAEATSSAEHLPEVDVSAVLADMQAPPRPDAVVSSAPTAPTPMASEEPVDVADLRPETPESTAADLRPQTPGSSAADFGPEPSTLELELMAGAEHAGAQAAGRHQRDRFPGVPDLETVLAEAGVEEVTPPPGEEIAPPPAQTQGLPRESLLMFDPNDDEGK